uniref:DUF1618 domain-containing protein n=1 Tax=Oryza barthii TaxID=65489 RepID=A0A0D3FU22_9ORYZ
MAWTSLEGKHFLDSSLVLPPHGHHHAPSDDDAHRSSALVDLMAFIADRRNATTARCAMRNGPELQVTLCVDAPLPRVSYFCVWCPGERPTELATEPCIVAAEADLVVFAAVRGNARHILNLDKTDVFIYQAAGGGGGASSIRRLGDLEPHFSAVYNIGLLRHSVAHPGGGDGEHGHYYIVTLHPGYTSSWEYVLYVFDSKTGSWSDRTVSLGPEHRHSQFNCSPSKVIVLGNGGLMAFVDLWRGIIVVDVLDRGVPPRFILLPRALRSRRILRMDAGIVRDVNHQQQQQQQQQPDVINGGATSNVASRLRKVSMWSRMATWEEDDDWRRDHIFSVPDIIVDEDYALHLELLRPELQVDDATGRPTLRGLHITRPAISLNDDDKVYFMAKVDPWDKRGWVIAVDMRSKRLEDVGIFRAERVIGVDLSYTLCRISKYFSTSTGDFFYLAAQLCDYIYRFILWSTL